MGKQLRCALVLVLAVVMVGCAVQRNQAPQITPATATDLNLAFQVQQANKDYETFFRDVGAAQTRGILTGGQVVRLNQLGNPARIALENANRTLRTYESTKDQGARAQVIGYIKQVNELLGQLLTNRAAMLSGTGGV